MFDSDKKLVVSRYSLLPVPTVFRLLVRQQRDKKNATEFYSLSTYRDTYISYIRVSVFTKCPQTPALSTVNLFVLWLSRFPLICSVVEIALWIVTARGSLIIRTDTLREHPLGLISTLTDSREFVSFEDDFTSRDGWRSEGIFSRKLSKKGFFVTKSTVVFFLQKPLKTRDPIRFFFFFFF